MRAAINLRRARKHNSDRALKAIRSMVARAKFDIETAHENLESYKAIANKALATAVSNAQKQQLAISDAVTASINSVFCNA